MEAQLIIESFKGNFKKGMCDTRTKGMVKYGHAELQIVVDLSQRIQMDIIKNIGTKMLENSIIVQDGVDVYGVVALGPVRFQQVQDKDGEYLWRLILPDMYGNMPETTDVEAFVMQTEDNIYRDDDDDDDEYEECDYEDDDDYEEEFDYAEI